MWLVATALDSAGGKVAHLSALGLGSVFLIGV